MISPSACLPRSATDQLDPLPSTRPAVSYTIRWDVIACKGRENPDYECEGWIKLRNRVVERDGGRCRNCGDQSNGLEVHHFLPVASDAEGVDERGYALGDCPLIVPESGLITLCALCHADLTERRYFRLLKNDPRLVELGQPRPPEKLNIFMLWHKGGEKVPFKAFKSNWNPNTEQYYLVEKIEIKKWPYGTAWGRYVREGEAGELGKIGGAGTYTWWLFDEDRGSSSSD